MSRRRWLTRGCATDRVSTQSFRRWRSTARSLSIRRFGKKRYSIADLLSKDEHLAGDGGVAQAVVKARLNMLVCGGTGSGKTTMLNCLSSFVPHDERIVTIEDSAELSLQQTHVVRLETRPPNLEGKGEVTARELVRNTLRMRPDRIIVGEVRGAEVFDMLQAMSTGHDGSIATIHANSSRECLGRLEMMMLLSGFSIPQRAMRQQVASAINIIVHVARLSDGSRRMMKISEVTGMEGEAIMMQDLFEFVQTQTDASGKVLGHYRPTGIRSAYAQRIERAGYKLDSVHAGDGDGLMDMLIACCGFSNLCRRRRNADPPLVRLRGGHAPPRRSHSLVDVIDPLARTGPRSRAAHGSLFKGLVHSTRPDAPARTVHVASRDVSKRL